MAASSLKNSPDSEQLESNVAPKQNELLGQGLPKAQAPEQELCDVSNHNASNNSDSVDASDTGNSSNSASNSTTNSTSNPADSSNAAISTDPVERIYSLLVDRDEVTWKDLLYNLIKVEGMDPWDIKISQLAKKYLKAVKVLKELDFRISGKVVLASAILLRLKSKRLIGEDLDRLDSLINSVSFSEDEFHEFDALAGFFPDDFSSQDFYSTPLSEDIPPEITLKTPQPRTRKLTVLDLVDALERAMNVNERRINRLSMHEKTAPRIPKKSFDIKNMAVSVYTKVISLFKKRKVVYFNDIIKSPNKEDVIYSFIPLLHLDFSKVVNLIQDEHFGKIKIDIVKKLESPEKINSTIKF